MPPSYTVVLATYNEAENLPVVVDLVNTHVRDTETQVIVVDDNSPDGTAQVFEKLKDAYPELKMKLIKRAGKQGLGTAYLAALKEITTDFTIIMDADLSHHPRYIPKMMELQKSDGLDVVSGSRYIPGGGVVNWPFKRRATSVAANFFAKTLLQVSASDLTGSFRLYRTTVLKALTGNMLSTGYTFQTEIIARASHAGVKIGEVPIVFVDRLYGDSNFNGAEIKEFCVNVLTMFWRGL